MIPSIFGDLPRPAVHKEADWKEWGRLLVHTLELQGQQLTQAITSFETANQTLDALGRLRVSIPNSAHDSFFEYDAINRVWDTALVGTGTSVFTTPQRDVILSTGGTASGARAMRQQLTYMRFREGVGVQICFYYTPVSAGFPLAGAAKSRAGYFDDNDGVYFQVSAASNAFVLRGSGTGSVVEVVIPQTNWNLDRLNGGGGSRITLDVTKPQALIICFNSLNAGRIRFGFRFGEETVYAHEVTLTNITPPVRFVRKSLPLRIEAFNSGGAGSNFSMEFSSVYATHEGGNVDEEAFLSAAFTPTQVAINVAGLTPILSVRLKDTFNGLEVHGLVSPWLLSVFNTGNSGAFFTILGNATLTGAVWNSVGPNSILELDTSATAVAGGDQSIGGFVPTATGSGTAVAEISVNFPTKIHLGRTYTTNTRTTLTLAARSIGGASSVGATALFKEFF
jgi:hypothetical protein